MFKFFFTSIVLYILEDQLAEIYY